jgi:hypothetical protein
VRGCETGGYRLAGQPRTKSAISGPSKRNVEINKQITVCNLTNCYLRVDLLVQYVAKRWDCLSKAPAEPARRVPSKDVEPLIPRTCVTR